MNRKAKIAEQVYIQPRSNKPWRLEDLIGHCKVRYFSYGRHALAEGLKIAGVTAGDKVLIPDFICRDLLSAIQSLAAIVVYYPVDRNLVLAIPPDKLPEAKVVLAVNYFGFPQKLEQFWAYCMRTGAVLIEDNAHGFFSRDTDGRLLGTRGDLGIFSMRKTISMPNGAALVLNQSDKKISLIPQIGFDSSPETLSFRIKKVLKYLIPFVGTFAARSMTLITRRIRKIRTGSEIAPSEPDAETVLPGNPKPCKKLFSYLAVVDVEREIVRRRELYLMVDNIIKNIPAQPVFEELPEGTVPYMYPFYVENSEIQHVMEILKTHDLEAFPWPELPDAVVPYAPSQYKAIWGVSFLW